MLSSWKCLAQVRKFIITSFYWLCIGPKLGILREFWTDGQHSNKDVSRRRVVEEDLVEEKRLHAFREGSSQEDSLSIQLADFGQHPLVGLFSHRMKSQKLLTLIKDKTLD